MAYTSSSEEGNLTHLKEIVENLLAELKLKNDHAQALPDMAISLLESYVTDDQIPESLVVHHIMDLTAQDGFPPDKKEKIDKLLKELSR